MQIGIWLGISLLLAGYRSAAAQGTVTERALLDAEHAFAHAVAQYGIRDAFLTYLADEAVVFRPGPLPGKKVYAADSPSTAVLAWHPVYVEVSSGGDLGYTTGPYEVRKSAADSTPVAFGEYLSFWRRQKDETWRAVLDVGIGHPRPDKRESGIVFYSTQSHVASAIVSRGKNISSSRQLLSLDRTLSRRSVEHGFEETLLSVAADDIRLMRSGTFPVLGRDSIHAIAARSSNNLTWTPVGGSIAHSGDLGYTYGTVHATDGKESSYVRIWRRGKGGVWKVVLDLMQ